MQGAFFVCLFLLGVANCSSVENKWDDVSKSKQFKRKDTGSERWHIHVTMHVYSGRPDPTWVIPYSHPSYKVIMRNIGAIRTRNLPCKLGYKGFSLVHIPIGESVATGGHFNKTLTSYPNWEMYLLQTSVGIADELRLHAKHTILETKARRKRRSLLYPDYDYDSLYYAPSTVDPINALSNSDMFELAKLWGLDKRFKNITTTPPLTGPTRFEPEKWNKYFVKKHNNCYNYANNRITDTFAQPGRAGDCTLSLRMLNGTEVDKCAKCDGLQAIFAPDLNKLPKHSWNLVALVFWPPKPGSDDADFHWYRLDDDGRWSHKPGKTSATNVDQSGKPIYDPRHADRGPYTEFVGFLQTRQDKVILI